MDLIPVAKEASATENAQRQVALSASAVRLAEVTVAPVERRSVAVEIDMVGKIQFDETRLAYISPRVPGRIDRLYANYVGMAVKAGMGKCCATAAVDGKGCCGKDAAATKAAFDKKVTSASKEVASADAK